MVLHYHPFRALAPQECCGGTGAGPPPRTTEGVVPLLTKHHAFKLVYLPKPWLQNHTSPNSPPGQGRLQHPFHTPVLIWMSLWEHGGLSCAVTTGGCQHYFIYYSHVCFLHPLHTELVSCPSSPRTWLEGLSPWSLLSHQALVLSRMENGSVVPAREMNLEQPQAVSLKVHVSGSSSSCPRDAMFVDASTSWGGTHPGSEGHQSMRLCLCICWSLFLEAAGWPAGTVPSFLSTQGILWTDCHPICL